MNILSFDKLTEDQKQKCIDFNVILEAFSRFSDKCTLKLFMNLYGENRGLYFWTMLNRGRSDLYIIYKGMSSDEKGILISNILFNDTLYALT